MCGTSRLACASQLPTPRPRATRYAKRQAPASGSTASFSQRDLESDGDIDTNRAGSGSWLRALRTAAKLPRPTSTRCSRTRWIAAGVSVRVGRRGGLGGGVEGALPRRAVRRAHRRRAVVARARAAAGRRRDHARPRDGVRHRPARDDAHVPGGAGAHDRTRCARARRGMRLRHPGDRGREARRVRGAGAGHRRELRAHHAARTPA